MVFPELDLVIATTGGSYISRGWRFAGGELIANYLLPLLLGAGDDEIALTHHTTDGMNIAVWGQPWLACQTFSVSK